MFNQIDTYLELEDLSKLYSDISVKLHGYIMSKLNKSYADCLHKQGVNPFSLFAIKGDDCIIVRISTITNEAVQIIEAIEKSTNITIYGVERPIVIKKIEKTSEISFEKLKTFINKRKYKITVITPASYKTNGYYYNLPNIGGYFNSVANKLNKYCGANIDMMDVKKVFEGLQIKDYSFQSEQFSIGGNVIPSMVGRANIMIRTNGQEKNLLGLLLAAATYTGIGGKTSLGMGGFLIEEGWY